MLHSMETTFIHAGNCVSHCALAAFVRLILDGVFIFIYLSPPPHIIKWVKKFKSVSPTATQIKRKQPKTIHSFHGTCRMQRFLAILRSVFHSSLLCTFSCRPSPPTVLPFSLTSSYHLFLSLPLSLVVPKFIYNTLLGILFPSILCTCPNQCNLFNLIVSFIVGFLTLA